MSNEYVVCLVESVNWDSLLCSKPPLLLWLVNMFSLAYSIAVRLSFRAHSGELLLRQLTWYCISHFIPLDSHVRASTNSASTVCAQFPRSAEQMMPRQMSEITEFEYELVNFASQHGLLNASPRFNPVWKAVQKPRNRVNAILYPSRPVIRLWGGVMLSLDRSQHHKFSILWKHWSCVNTSMNGLLGRLGFSDFICLCPEEAVLTTEMLVN